LSKRARHSVPTVQLPELYPPGLIAIAMQ